MELKSESTFLAIEKIYFHKDKGNVVFKIQSSNEDSRC